MGFRICDIPKRNLISALLTLAVFTSKFARADTLEIMLKEKYRGITGVVVKLDVAGDAASRDWIALYTDLGRQIAAPSHLGRKGNQILGFTSGLLPVPKTVRVTWREEVDGKKPQMDDHQGWVGGKVVGDYTVEVASRIPDEVLNYIRSGQRRALRLKLRLKDDGVLLGWDVEERRPEGGHVWRMPGGDFKEAVILNGKLAQPGWVILPDGRKTETPW